MLREPNKYFPLRAITLLLLIQACIAVMFSSCYQSANIVPPAKSSYSKVIDSATDLYNRGYFGKSISYIKSRIKDTTKLSPTDRFDYLYLCFSYYDHTQINNRLAMAYADGMLAVTTTAGNHQIYPRQYCLACFAKGDVYYRMGNYAQAFQYYYLGKMGNNANIGTCALGEYSYRMAMTKYKQEHFADAAGYFKQSFSEFSGCDNDFRIFYLSQGALDNIALCYTKINKPDEAQVYFDKALSYINSYEQKFNGYKAQIEVAKAVIYGNYAQILTTKHQYAKAEHMLKVSIGINLNKDNDFRDAELTELKLARLYDLTHRLNQEFALMTELKTQFKSVGNNAAEADWNLIMAKYYRNKNDYQHAFQYFSQYSTLKDSINKKNEAIKEYDESKEFKVFEDDRMIKDQQHRQELDRVYILVATAIVLLSILIIIPTFYVWRRSKVNLGVMTELNARVKEQNESLQKALGALEENNREKDRILHAVAHDLRNPLGGIASLTAMIIDDKSFDAEHREFLALIQIAAQNSLELINEILEATINTNVKPSERKWVDINLLLNNCVELMRFKAAEKNQQIMLQTLDSPQKLLINHEKIWRVINNLVSNAIKFSPDGSTIRVKMLDINEYVQIEVNDSGIGIPEDMRNIVFQMFTEAKRPGTNGEKSFGLGLSVSKQIIENHDGDIWFESHADAGTSFYVKLKK